MKKLLTSSIAAASTLAFPLTAFAQNVGCNDANNPLCTIGNTAIGVVLAQVIQFIFVIGVILALGFLVYGGIKWLTSGGDKEAVAGARGTIIAAIVGLIIIFLAYVILNIVLLFLVGEGFGEIVVPTLSPN